jgi:hypothetical protein
MRAHMPVTELSRISGIRRQTYMQLRTTTRRPRRDIVLSLAAAVGLDTDEALALAGLNPVDSDMVRRMIAEAIDLSSQQKASLNALLDVYDTEDEENRPAVKLPRQQRRLGIAQVA